MEEERIIIRVMIAAILNFLLIIGTALIAFLIIVLLAGLVSKIQDWDMGVGGFALILYMGISLIVAVTASCFAYLYSERLWKRMFAKP